MPFKRTRSATAGQPDGNSSNVTDYMGPPTTKRQKSHVKSADHSARLSTSSQAARKSAEKPQSKAASTRRYTMQQDVEEEEDDGSIHVAVDQVISAVNTARFGQPRSINGLQPRVRQAGLNVVTEDGDEEGEDEEGEDEEGEGEEGEGEEVNGEEEALPVRKRAQAIEGNQVEQQGPPRNHQTKSKSLSRMETARSTDNVDNEPIQRRELRPRKYDASAHGTRKDKPAPMPTQQRQGKIMESAAPVEDGPQADDDLESEDEEGEEDMQDASAQGADDSAFIDAPRPNDKLPEVNVTIKNVQGMIKTLRGPAWTGRTNWDQDPEMACLSKTSGKLINRLRQLNDLLLQAYDMRYEGDADADPKVTIDYLRRNNKKINGLCADITGLIDRICTQKLAVVDEVGTRGVQTRKRYLCDITKRLMPMLVLVLQKACDVGPSAPGGKNGVVHLTLNSFTTQFPLRTIGWAIRLMDALSRGLERWPIDELDQSDEELDIADVDKEMAKISNNRVMLQKHLALLYSTFQNAAGALERQANETERKKRQEQDRRRALMEAENYRHQAMERERELRAKYQREKQEVKRKEQTQMRKFLQASQALKSVPDPLADLWREAGRLRHTPAASQVFVPNPSLPLRRPSKSTDRAPLQVRDDSAFFLNTKDDQFAPPNQSDRVSSDHSPQTGIPRTINGLQPAQAFEKWGAPKWSKAEEQELMIWMNPKHGKYYNPSTLAQKLGRLSEDVIEKAAELKAEYRAIYKKRGADIPSWAW
ncbi:hypothetical protein N0V82_006897 [Gnomoniopsis sp. IMI 355080]|nr:hypothetical protein N0V82_006897 [Gnomoniopsis sp. IMI 355080]